MMSFEDFLPVLRNIELFRDFAEESDENRRILDLVYQNMSVKNFKKGEIIIKEGDTGDSFYILKTGKIQVLRLTPAKDEMALANLSAGQSIFFGESALIGTDTRSATVKALTDSSAFVLSSKKFLEICETEPLLGYRVVSVLARRMADTIKQTNSDKAILYQALCDEIEFGV